MHKLAWVQRTGRFNRHMVLNYQTSERHGFRVAATDQSRPFRVPGPCRRATCGEVPRTCATSRVEPSFIGGVAVSKGEPRTIRALSVMSSVLTCLRCSARARAARRQQGISAGRWSLTGTIARRGSMDLARGKLGEAGLVRLEAISREGWRMGTVSRGGPLSVLSEYRYREGGGGQAG